MNTGVGSESLELYTIATKPYLLKSKGMCFMYLYHHHYHLRDGQLGDLAGFQFHEIAIVCLYNNA